MGEINRSVFQRVVPWPMMIARYAMATCKPFYRLNRGEFIRILGRINIKIYSGGDFSRKSGTILDSGVFVEIRGKLSFSNSVYVGRNCHIVCFERVTIGENVRIGEKVSIHDENHTFEPLPLSEEDRKKYNTSPISIGNRVWIGAGVIVLPGTTIGNDTVVAAGSVVKGTLEPESLYAGVPAKFIRKLTHQSKQR